MALESGTKLSHYEITGQIGKGGMGEVYRARDAKLGREVAIKVLPTEFSQDTERLARLEREARMLASLNHPNIAAIHGLEESDDTRFLVLELVEGDTLADRLQQGAIPAEESLKLALQVAEALEAAHDKGVIHRDLKPANIKITPEGRIKVLDFGLAKAFIGDQVGANLSNSPTLSMQATQQGLILGTAAYMSPEQAKGLPADKRADVFAFGCVLFEMLTSRQAFQGQLATEILASVIAKEPDYTALQSNLHPRIKALLVRCLEKEPANRWQAVGDLRFELQQILDDPHGLAVQPAAAAGQVVPQSKLLWTATVVLAVLIGGAAVWLLRPSDPRNVVRFSHLLGGEEAFSTTNRSVVAVSPDGTHLAYVANAQLYLLDLGNYESVPIPGTDENPSEPAFSPDGESLVFWSSDQQLKTIPIGGGTPVAITSGPSIAWPFGITWEDNGMILYSEPEVGGIWQVPETGGEPENIVEAGPDELIYGASLLPGETHVLFSTWTGSPDDAQIVAESLASGERTTIWSGGNDARYIAETGLLVFAFEGDLFAVPFDPDTLETTGRQVSVVSGVRRAPSGTAHYDVSDSGTLVHVPGAGLFAGETSSLVFFDRQGNVDEILEGAGTRNFEFPRLSPGDTRIAVQINDGEGADVWIYEITSSQLRQLTLTGGERPIWSPDGSEITFLRNNELWTIRSDFNGGEEVLPGTEAEAHDGPGAWSPDGVLLFGSGEGLHAWERSDTDANTAGTASLIISGQDNTISFFPDFSPDGSHLVYTSNRSGDPEIYADTYPVSAERRISTDLGIAATWVRNGTELISFVPRAPLPFETRAITTDPRLEWGNPEWMFDGGTSLGFFPAAERRRGFDVTANGQRLLFALPAGAVSDQDAVTGSPRINVVLNWLTELRERVPVD